MTTQEQVALNPDLIGAKWYVEEIQVQDLRKFSTQHDIVLLLTP
jgi:hypothetical protein